MSAISKLTVLTICITSVICSEIKGQEEVIAALLTRMDQMERNLTELSRQQEQKLPSWMGASSGSSGTAMNFL